MVMTPNKPAKSQTPVNSRAVHLSLQGKGGVGKSLVASWLAQYLSSRGDSPICVDADPINHTFASIQALEATVLPLARDVTIDVRAFDTLIERLVSESGTFVIDSGAATFLPLWQYLLENQVAQFLREQGRDLFIHMVIVGGAGLADTLNGLDQLCAASEERNVMVWLNEYFGPVAADGKQFSQMATAVRNRDKLSGSVLLPRRSPDTYGRDIQDMMSAHLTFEQAINDSTFPLMSKQRLRMVQREVFAQLDQIPWEQGRAVNL